MANNKEWPMDDIEKLKVALQEKDGKAIEYLIENMDVNACDAEGMTALHVSAYYGSYRATKYLIEKRGAKVNARDSLKNTPLHYAAQFGHENTAEQLLANGAETEAMNMHGVLPFDAALLHGQGVILGLIRQYQKINKYKAAKATRDFLGVGGYNDIDEAFFPNKMQGYDADGYTGKYDPSDEDGFYIGRHKNQKQEVADEIASGNCLASTKQERFGTDSRPFNEYGDNQIARTSQVPSRQNYAPYIEEEDSMSAKEHYLTKSAKELISCLINADELQKICGVFHDDLTPIVEKLSDSESMRIYVSIYKKLNPTARKSYEQAVRDKRSNKVDADQSSHSTAARAKRVKSSGNKAQFSRPDNNAAEKER